MDNNQKHDLKPGDIILLRNPWEAQRQPTVEEPPQRVKLDSILGNHFYLEMPSGMADAYFGSKGSLNEA